jgi:hypothetical protein
LCVSVSAFKDRTLVCIPNLAGKDICME